MKMMEPKKKPSFFKTSFFLNIFLYYLLRIDIVLLLLVLTHSFSSGAVSSIAGLSTWNFAARHGTGIILLILHFSLSE
jgi:hypothetical protein